MKWVRELGQGRFDLDLLLTAGYIHDIGWSGVAPKGKIDFQEMLKFEPKANKNSPVLITKVLNELQFLDLDIQTVIRLVSAADRHESEREDEAIIVDADNLSKLNIEHLTEKYQPESFTDLIERWEVELPSRIKTKKGKELFPKLLSDLKLRLKRQS